MLIYSPCICLNVIQAVYLLPALANDNVCGEKGDWGRLARKDL